MDLASVKGKVLGVYAVYPVFIIAFMSLWHMIALKYLAMDGYQSKAEMAWIRISASKQD